LVYLDMRIDTLQLRRRRRRYVIYKEQNRIVGGVLQEDVGGYDVNRLERAFCVRECL
jgi:hypothetical protein